MSIFTKKLQSTALRNVSVVSVHKAGQIVGQIVAVATIPRLLGAEDHGRFAFVLSFGFLLQILGDFGTLEVMSRFVPTMNPAEARRLYVRTLVFKVGVGLLCGAIAVGAGLLLAPWLRPEWAILIGVGVAAHIVAWVPFQFLLGVNRVGLWMVEQSWRQWVIVILLIVLYPWLGLGGTILAWTLMELIFCALGLWWARAHWSTPEVQLSGAYLWPYIKFGLGFFAANLVSAFLYRSGPVLVETLTRQSAEAGFLNLAIGLFLMPYLLLTQIAFSFVPTLSRLHAQGEHRQMQEWVQNFVRYSWLLGWLGVIMVWLTVDWGVYFVFGPDYVPAAGALKWISLGFPLAALLWGGNIVATVTGQGSLKLLATSVALAVSLLAMFWLVPTYQAAGAAIGLTLAIAANFGVLFLFLRSSLKLEWPVLLLSGLVGCVLLWLAA